MKCSSRLCARADAAARAVRKERAARQLSDVRKIFFVCVFMWAPLPSLRGTSGRVFRVSVASILPRARHGKGFLKKTRVYSFLGLKRVGLTAAGAEVAEGAQRLEHTHLSAQSQRPLRLCGELSRTPNSRMNRPGRKPKEGRGKLTPRRELESLRHVGLRAADDRHRVALGAHARDERAFAPGALRIALGGGDECARREQIVIGAEELLRVAARVPGRLPDEERRVAVALEEEGSVAAPAGGGAAGLLYGDAGHQEAAHAHLAERRRRRQTPALVRELFGVNRDLARLLVRQILLRVQHLLAGRGRAAEDFVNADGGARAPEGLDEAQAVAVAEDEGLCEERRGRGAGPLAGERGAPAPPPR